MSQLRRSIVAGMVFGAAVVAFAANGGGTRAAVAPAGNNAGHPGVAMLAGSQLAVVVPTFHNGQHTNVTTVAVGTTVHVRVTVSGAFGTPTGSIFGSIYANGTCSGSPVDQSAPGFLDGPTIDLTSLSYKPTSAGKISTLVSYGGDDTYAERYSACTAIDVTKATPSIGMVVHNGAHAATTSLTWGLLVHPYVTINSRVGEPTGTFKVSWWENGTCSGAKADESITIGIGADGHTDATPFSKPAQPVGSFSFKVHYNGDAGFKAGDSACAPYTVTKLTPNFEAQVHNFQHTSPSTLPLGAQVHPFASVTKNGGPDLTGTVTVKRYSDGTCSNEVASNTKPADDHMEMVDLAVSSDVPYAMSWRITYSGDAVWSSAGGAVCFVRTWMAPSTLGFDIHDDDHDTISTIDAGKPVHFGVEVTGAFGVPTGSISLIQADIPCGNFGDTIANAALSQGKAHATQDTVTLEPGTHYFKAMYLGSDEYFGAKGCTTLTVTAPVTPKPAATPTLVPTAKPTAQPSAPSAPASTPASTPEPTDIASASDEPVASDAPAASGAPAPVPSAAPAATDASGAGAGSGTGAGSGSPTSPSGDGGPGIAWILLLVLIVVLVFGAGIALGRRRQQPAAEA